MIPDDIELYKRHFAAGSVLLHMMGTAETGWVRRYFIDEMTETGSPSVPVGYAFGLPVGMSFIGKANAEATLLKLAYGYEQAAKPRKPPRFLPSADLSRR